MQKKITKVDIARISLTVCQCAAEKNLPLDAKILEISLTEFEL